MIFKTIAVLTVSMLFKIVGLLHPQYLSNQKQQAKQFILYLDTDQNIYEVKGYHVS